MNNPDLRKVMAAIIAGPMLATMTLSEVERFLVEAGSLEQKAGIRTSKRARIASIVLGSVEVAELLCETSDAEPTNRQDVLRAFVETPPPMPPAPTPPAPPPQG